MRAVVWQRLAREAGLGLLAIGCALIVLLPGLWLVNLAFKHGLYTLLIATVTAGVLLLLYQVRLRPSLREPTMRAAAGLAGALRGAEEAPPRPSVAAFRVWGGVPIASLRVSVHRAEGAAPIQLAEALCAFVRARAERTATLSWALAEVGGDRTLLLQEPERAGAPLQALPGQLQATCHSEETFYHLWSANGAASYEEPVAFATVLMAQAVAGREPDLHDLAVRMAERVVRLPDIAGVEVLTTEARGGESPQYLWLAAGRNRTVRRQVYLALEPASATQGLAWTIDRYDLLACDAYAALTPAEPGAASAQPVRGAR